MLETDGAINMKSLINLAQDRLKDSEETMPEQGKSRHEIEGKLDALLRKQQEREVASIYPSPGEDGSSNPLPLELKFDNIEEEQPEEIHNPFKQSLTKALEEDVKLDEHRLVDPQFGTGGLYEYMPAHSIKGMEDWVAESEHYKYYQTSADFPLTIEPEASFHYPEHLSLYTYEMGNPG